MTEHRLILTDADKREELKLKALQSIAGSLSYLKWYFWAFVMVFILWASKHF